MGTQLGTSPSKVSQVSAEVEQLHREVEFCQKAFTELESRISAVVTSQNQCNEVAEKEISLTPLASDLRGLTWQLKCLGSALTNLRDRVEL